jgi:sec-independent protein translocase protein TatB
MFNVGGGELLVIALIALIVLGPQRLPDAARTVGRVMGELRRMSSGFQQELKDAFDPDIDDAPSPLRRKESAPLAATVAETDKAAERKAAAGRDSNAGRDHAVRDTDDADAAAGGGDANPVAGTPVAGTPGTGDVPGPVAAPDTVDPAVADAIDEIVSPLNPSSQVSPAAAAPGPPASTSSSAPDTPSAMAPSDPVDGPADGEGLGDQRAAS